MIKKNLREQAGHTTNMIAKLGKNENVSTEVLCKICDTLGCKADDIIDFISDSETDLSRKRRNDRYG